MEPAGFGMIASEWWHFQDNETRARLSPASVTGGVSIEGYKKDDKGWRYRTKRGDYLKNTTQEIDGVMVSFDPDGYVE